VVFDRVERDQRRLMMRKVRSAIRTFVPVDIVVADVDDLQTDRDVAGSPLYWPLSEGRVVYDRVQTGGS
jgi:hypothetical protein